VIETSPYSKRRNPACLPLAGRRDYFYLRKLPKLFQIFFAFFAALRESKTRGHPMVIQRALHGHSVGTLWALYGRFLGRSF